MGSPGVSGLGFEANSEILQTVFSCNGVNNKRMRMLSEDELYGYIKFIASLKTDFKEAFYVLDLGCLKSIMDQWNSKLPKIRPFYSLKSNSDPTLVASLAMLGSGFSCANRAEIESVLSLGVSPDRVIFANPCKSEAHIEYAATVGVNLASYDSEHEIEKIKKWNPNCSLLLQIKVGDEWTKFGALPQEILPLLRAAQMAELSVVGVTFHLGSTVTNPETYRTAIASAKMVFDTAIQLGLPRMRTLDIGGGFIACSKFDEIAEIIKASLEMYFGNEQELEMMSELGRFFSEKSFTLVVNIVGKRARGNLREYWINVGLHCGRTSGTIKPLACKSTPDNPMCHGLNTYASIVYICDCCENVFSNYELPELDINDVLVFFETGSNRCKFNGFDTLCIPTYIAYSDVCDLST